LITAAKMTMKYCYN